MGSDWKHVPFNELGEVNRGRSRHRPRYAEHLYGGPYPFIQTGDIRESNGRIVGHSQTYSEAGLEQSRLWPAGTMCITIAANIAETAILTYEACFPDSVVGFIADEQKCDVRFIEYSFRMLKKRLQAEATGSVQDNINLGTLSRLEIHLPPLPEQRAIAHILGTLDDKIELNRQMNRTLEAIARAIFKSWFVDFDPVHAKAEGREPAGMDAETAALFPDSFQDSPLGTIPKGWNIGSLDSLLELSRTSIKPQEHPEEEFDLYSIPAYDSGTPARDLGEAIRSSKYRVPSSAVLISKLNPHIPRVWLPQINKGKQAICSTEFLVCQPKANVPREYIYSLLSSTAFLDEFAQMVTGTTGSHQRVHPTAFIEMKVAEPPRELLAAFKEITEPLFSKCTAQPNESSNLAAIRSALLPRLLSGDLYSDAGLGAARSTSGGE